jgi:sterol desaturase/sphingolipid hydroxylase (fatty acid hydroxylase superfamily)
LLKSLDHLAQTFGQRFSDVLLAPGSMFSLEALGTALLIAGLSLAWPRLRQGRTVRVRTLARALFPDRLIKSPSSRADLVLFVFNSFPAAFLFGFAIASAGAISGLTAHALKSVLGPQSPSAMNPALARAIATLALFLAYEFAYWLDHYLSHKVPFLWEFHKVHHTAEVLTPLTNFRVHPIDTIVFANITAVMVGGMGGVLSYAFGGAVSPFALSGANVILVVFFFLTIHLQHSHIWISFTGLAGRIFLSPAHHQIHHSADPIHFNRNFGSCLSVWDWMFGTLQIPARQREPLSFGAKVRAGAPSPHSVTGVLLEPFVEAIRPLGAVLRRQPPGRAVSDLRRLPDSPA